MFPASSVPLGNGSDHELSSLCATLLLLPLGAVVVGLVPATARAALPLIRLDRIYPLGGKAGTTVEIEVRGKDVDEVSALHFDHPGLRAEPAGPLKMLGLAYGERTFRVNIAPETPAGTYEVRAVGRFGISNARLFAIQYGLTELQKTTPKGDADRIQMVPMNCVVNGYAAGNGEDCYRFRASKGKRLTIDCWAQRLDSQMDAVLAVATAEGKELASNRDYYEKDPFLDFRAPADGDYFVRVRDLVYNGGQPYRLVVSNRPHVDHVFPPAVGPGSAVPLTLLGATCRAASRRPGRSTDSPSTSSRCPLRRPGMPPAICASRSPFIPRRPAHSCAGVRCGPRTSRTALNPITLATTRFPVTLEREPNDDSDHAQELALPTTVCGRLDRRGDADWYTFTAKANEILSFDVLCERLQSQGDLYGVLFDDKGKEIDLNLDDHGPLFNALAQYNRDPQNTWTVPRDGRYRLLIQDRFQRGGPRFTYALQIGKAEPDFSPVVFHATNPEPTPSCARGGSALLEFFANRRDGFKGGIVVEATDLPPGLSCPPVHVGPNYQNTCLVFTAAPDAPEWTGPSMSWRRP